MIETLRRFDASQGPRKLGSQEGKSVDVAGLGVRFMVYGEESGGGAGSANATAWCRAATAAGGVFSAGTQEVTQRSQQRSLAGPWCS